jgi:hypothetical protein
MVEALTLSDLPSVTDLLDMEGSSPAGSAAGSAPLPDEDDDMGFFIEAPVLPEPPDVVDDDIAFLPEDEGMPPPAAKPEPGVLPSGASVGPESVVDHEPVQPPAEALPAVVAEEPAPAVSTANAAPRPVKAPVKADPFAALTSLKLDARRPATKPKAIDHKDAINSLMGELTQVGRSGAPSVLRLEVPAEADGQEIEVVVQLRCQGQVLSEGQIHRPAPGKGSTAKLSVELKRS